MELFRLYDLIIVFIILIAVFSAAVVLLSIGNRKTQCTVKFEDDCLLRDQINYLLKKRNFFMKNSALWMMINYSVSLIAVCANIIIIYICTYDNCRKNAVFVYSAIALIMTVFILTVNPVSFYQRFRKGYRILDSSLNHIENYYLCEFCEFSCNEKDNSKIKSDINVVKEIIERSINASEDCMDDF